MSSDDDPLCLVFMPALVAILLRAEKDSELALTKEQVLDIRDNATCIKMKLSRAIEMEEKRGYPDLAPEEVWEEWKKARIELYPQKEYGV